MIRIIGVLLALAGLIVVGMSGDNKRSAPNSQRLVIGMLMMLIGVVVALAATEIALLMGWARP
jgi:drug/metabolite transporter (DMT)-like permease